MAHNELLPCQLLLYTGAGSAQQRLTQDLLPGAESCEGRVWLQLLQSTAAWEHRRGGRKHHPGKKQGSAAKRGVPQFSCSSSVPVHAQRSTNRSSPRGPQGLLTSAHGQHQQRLRGLSSLQDGTFPTAPTGTPLPHRPLGWLCPTPSHTPALELG